MINKSRFILSSWNLSWKNRKTCCFECSYEKLHNINIDVSMLPKMLFAGYVRHVWCNLQPSKPTRKVPWCMCTLDGYLFDDCTWQPLRACMVISLHRKSYDTSDAGSNRPRAHSLNTCRTGTHDAWKQDLNTAPFGNKHNVRYRIHNDKEVARSSVPTL